MTCEEKARLLQKKKEARKMRLSHMGSDVKAKLTQIKKGAHQKCAAE